MGEGIELTWLSGAIQVAGLALIVAGCFALALWFGLIALGAALVLCGFAIDPAG